jgi:sulfate/thiosulfate transport system substrate-binding protein
MHRLGSRTRARTATVAAATVVVVLAGAIVARGGTPGPATPAGHATVRTLTLGGYTTPREVYGRRILPAFQKHWKATTGEEVRFRESYLGSGAQARAVVGGFEADVAALSLEPDIETVRQAGLITRDWKGGAHRGMVSRSIVVIAVRAGNPKGIRDWADLRRPGIRVLTPNPRTSGGAMWNIAAMYGAALRGGTPVARGDSAGAEGLLRDVLRNVDVMDKGARESMITFERGVGDAAITYENEVLVARQAGKAVDYVVPRSTILIENPVAVVDAYAEKHGTRDLADAFVRFLGTAEAQRAYAEYGLRPVDEQVTPARPLPAVGDLFTIADMGGWPAVARTIFADGGVFDRASNRVASR